MNIFCLVGRKELVYKFSIESFHSCKKKVLQTWMKQLNIYWIFHNIFLLPWVLTISQIVMIKQSRAHFIYPTWITNQHHVTYGWEMNEFNIWKTSPDGCFFSQNIIKKYQYVVSTNCISHTNKTMLRTRFSLYLLGIKL